MNDLDPIRPVVRIAAIGLTVLLMQMGCTASYTVSLRDEQTKEPVPEASVIVSSAPRIYSFLDPRHYFASDSHRPAIARATTNSQGEANVTLPRELEAWKVCASPKWMAKAPFAEWTPMLAQDELESNANRGQVHEIAGRLQVRVQRSK